MASLRAEGRPPKGCPLELASMRARGGWVRDPLVVIAADALRTYSQILKGQRLAPVALWSLFDHGKEPPLQPRPWACVRDLIAALLPPRVRVGLVFNEPWTLRETAGEE
eukprot:4906622-Pyramimonas_sp.AAC.1